MEQAQGFGGGTGSAGIVEDYIGMFFNATAGISSPDSYRIWTAIAMIASALERRVWVKTANRRAYCNLYTLLVGAPGVGKGIVNDAREILHGTREPPPFKSGAFFVSPHNLTPAALMDRLKKSKHAKSLGGEMRIFHSLAVFAEEFQLFFPAYDPMMIARLNHLYENKDSIEEDRRYAEDKELSIIKPQLNILAGAQPAYISGTFPEEAWTTGLGRRIMMIYSAEETHRKLGDMADIAEADIRKLQARLVKLSELWGELDYEPEAFRRLEAWHDAKCPPVPVHSKLQAYSRNRTLNAIKLSAISYVSRGGTVPGKITLIDVERALNWLFTAEALMPDVFREMAGKSDQSVIEELHLWMTAMFRRTGGKGIDETDLYLFLKSKTPSEKVGKILEVAARSGAIANVSGTQLWVPRPKHLHGME